MSDQETETFICHTININNRHIVLGKDKKREYHPSRLVSWEIEHYPIRPGDEIQASSEVVQLGLVAANGANEPTIVKACKGRYYLMHRGKSWKIPTAPAGTPLNGENIDAFIPRSVLTEFGYHCEMGVFDIEALNEAKNAPSGTTPNT